VAELHGGTLAVAFPAAGGTTGTLTARRLPGPAAV
jgi:hypothetical protein